MGVIGSNFSLHGPAKRHEEMSEGLTETWRSVAFSTAVWDRVAISLLLHKPSGSYFVLEPSPGTYPTI